MNFNKSDIKKYNKYYSTNKELIHNINISPYLDNETLIIEPFYGDGDLLNMFEIDNEIIINDITEINTATIKDKLNIVKILNKDSLKKCLWKKYENDIFIITNPPYKAKNKLSKELKENYAKLLTNNINDLYLIFINQLIKYPIKGGFIIIPSNFIFGKRNNIYNEFIKVYSIITLNIYEKQTFKDTSQSVISLLFVSKEQNINEEETKIYLHRKEEIINIPLQLYNKIIYRDFKDWLKHDNKNIKHLKISRLFNKSDDMFASNIRVSLLDYNMYAFYANEIIQEKETDRSFISVCFNKEFTKEEQLKLIEIFNEKLTKIRNKTYSLILTSYREFDRKRLSFNEAFEILKYAVNKQITNR